MQKRHAFTLVEMLLVVALLAMLIAMLLPGLTHGRSLARTAVCMTQENQIHLAVATYLRESQGRFAGRRNWGRWYDNIATKTPIAATHADAYWGLAYADAVGRDSLRPLFRCPEALNSDMNTSTSNSSNGHADGKFEDGHVYNTYGFNGLETSNASTQGVTASPFFNYALSGAPGRTLRALRNPSKTIMFQDAFEHLLDGNGDMPWSMTQWTSIQNREYFRHNMNKAGNVVWADGHIETVPITFAWTAKMYSGQ